MKRILMILTIALFTPACDSPDEAKGDSTDDTTAAGSETTAQPTDTDVEAMGEIAPGSDWLTANPRPAALGKECNATCTVASYGGSACPTTISGYGKTTFLGGCKKACSKARNDAASKLPAGCIINACNLTGC